MAELFPTVVIDPADDVAVALRAIEPGEAVAPNLKAIQPIPAGHKVALKAVAAGAPVRKYGFPIGRARVAIAIGEHVHSHNLATDLSTGEAYAFRPRAAEATPGASSQTFDGYLRPDGRVGTRNEIW